MIRIFPELLNFNLLILKRPSSWYSRSLNRVGMDIIHLDGFFEPCMQDERWTFSSTIGERAPAAVFLCTLVIVHFQILGPVHMGPKS